MNERFFMVLALVAFAGLGCDKKTAAAKTENGGETQLSDDDVPVKGDFVEEAESSITPANYKSELDKLGEEIDKDKE